MIFYNQQGGKRFIDLKRIHNNFGQQLKIVNTYKKRNMSKSELTK